MKSETTIENKGAFTSERGNVRGKPRRGVCSDVNVYSYARRGKMVRPFGEYLMLRPHEHAADESEMCEATSDRPAVSNGRTSSAAPSCEWPPSSCPKVDVHAHLHPQYRTATATATATAAAATTTAGHGAPSEPRGVHSFTWVREKQRQNENKCESTMAD
ncbi:hypothetical protein V9T40_008020 [Parthenolecanium corni]|uniref:Uncharacterized protein n=1 Tax=Parthenolecanium corni TaxID=536013 RepID=A0AAN9TT66_9HEMI